MAHPQTPIIIDSRVHPHPKLKPGRHAYNRAQLAEITDISMKTLKGRLRNGAGKGLFAPLRTFKLEDRIGKTFDTWKCIELGETRISKTQDKRHRYICECIHCGFRREITPQHLERAGQQRGVRPHCKANPDVIAALAWQIEQTAHLVSYEEGCAHANEFLRQHKIPGGFVPHETGASYNPQFVRTK